MKRYLTILCLGFVALFTSCGQGDQTPVTEETEGDLDETDLFTIPLESSGPADERFMERMEKKETK